MKKKNIVLILSLIVLLSITLIGTYAYQMYSQDTITNTFTVGNVDVELYEKSQNGAKVSTNPQEYVLERGKTYNKNMVVNIDAGSEACYVFIVMKNELAAIESAAVEKTQENLNVEPYTPVEYQIVNNGWKLWPSGTSNSNVKIYWQSFNKNDGTADEKEFMSSFRTKDDYDYNLVHKDDNSSPVMTFTLYAIEKSNLSESQAWDLLVKKFSSDLGS